MSGQSTNRSGSRALPGVMLVAVVAIGALLASCFGGDDEGETPSTDAFEAPQVIAIVQGWPLLHANDYECGTATITDRTVITAVARREFLEFNEACEEDDDGTDVTRAVRLATNSDAWTAQPSGENRWLVTLDPGTARSYQWLFYEEGPRLVASGGAARLDPLFNFASPAGP